jgi:hypothetical protein
MCWGYPLHAETFAALAVGATVRAASTPMAAALRRPAQLFFALSLLAAPLGHACQVPVFRYALERWAPAKYLVTVTPGAGGLTDAEKKVVDVLRAARNDPANPANLEVQVAAPGAGAATMALHYPQKLRASEKEPLWQGPLTAENAQLLLDSPLRRGIRDQLLAGRSAIWLLVESGDPAKDDAAAATLTEAIDGAIASLKLPDGVVTPGQVSASGRAKENAEVLRSDLPLKIDFSLLRVQRDDPKEATLVAMLTHLEDDLGTYASEPMVFPVFGRGRVLEPLIGAGIHKDNVMEHSGYLCGACSCEVKEQNPGIDLLMVANWEPVDTTPKIEIVRIAPAPAPVPSASHRTPLLAAGGGLLLLGLAGWTLRRRISKAA